MICFAGCVAAHTAGCRPVVPSSWEATGAFRAATGVAAAPQRGANPPFFLRYRYESGKAERATEGGPGVVEKNNVRHICLIGCDRVCSATTPHPSVPKEGTTLGARHCSGRHGSLPLRLDADCAGCVAPLLSEGSGEAS